MMQYLVTIVSILFSGYVYADIGVAKNAVPLGAVTHNIMQPTTLLTDFAYLACYIIGLALIVGAGMQYRTHRMNPMQVPLSRVIFWLVFGIAIFVLPFVAQWSSASNVFGKYH